MWSSGNFFRYLIVCSSVVAAGCGQDNSAATTPSGSPSLVLRRALSAEPDSLDPQLAQSVEAHTVLRDVCEGLVVLDRNALPVPGAALAWEISPDGLEYRFTLRARLRWSDGQPILARNFVAGLRRLATPDVAAPYAALTALLRNGTAVLTSKMTPDKLGIVTDGETVVVARLEHPAPEFLSWLAHPAACPYRDGTTGSPEFSGSGAFRVQEYIAGSHVMIRKNAFYRDANKVQLEGVRYAFIAASDTQYKLFRAGTLDVTSDIPRQLIADLRTDPASGLNIAPRAATYFYGFNLQMPPLASNVNLRAALSMAIDRRRLVAVLGAIESPANTLVPPTTAGHVAASFLGIDNTNSPVMCNPEAKRRFSVAGFSSSKPLSVSLSYNAGGMHETIAIAVAAMWKECLGVETLLRKSDFKSLLQDVAEGKTQVFRSSWTADYNSPLAFLEVFASAGANNQSRFASKEYDRLLHLGRTAKTSDARETALAQAESLLLSSYAIIPLYHQVSKRLISPRVKSWATNALDVTYSRDVKIN